MKGTRILLIEDHADAAEMLAAVLEAKGHRVEKLDRAVDALAHMRTRRPDVVLCDIGLPTLNGYDFARAVRADGELGAVPMVALTGYGQPSDRARALEAGFNDHLVKPVNADAVDDVLRRLVVSVGPAPRE